MAMRSLKFIDLFAGLGGFHLALSRLGARCVFASEIDADLRALYQLNFGIDAAADVRGVSLADIPEFDVLCAGFPCQPFSKAGDQLGTSCPESGDLFHGHVVRILRARRPQYLLLENVPNLARHAKGDTWRRMRRALERLGYEIAEKIISPHHVGIPQIRERMFVVGSQRGLNGFDWPVRSTAPLSIRSILDESPADARPLTKQVVDCLHVWQEFLDRSRHVPQLPSFPIWSMEFGATYPFRDATPHSVGLRALRAFRGNHGTRLRDVSALDRLSAIPSYARREHKFPGWKIDFIRQNRNFYAENRKWIDPWMPKILNFPPSLQKFEWNCKGETRDLWKTIIQFRASGVRVKRPTTAPSLVAMTTTQVPIIGWERRYMTARECARLQCLDSLSHLPRSATQSYRALGNAVNARLVEQIGAALFGRSGRQAARIRPERRRMAITS